jgi:hypothetical protein
VCAVRACVCRLYSLRTLGQSSSELYRMLEELNSFGLKINLKASVGFVDEREEKN